MKSWIVFNEHQRRCHGLRTPQQNKIELRMRPTILCGDSQQAVTTIFAVGIRPPGRVWIELERDRCRTIIIDRFITACAGHGSGRPQPIEGLKKKHSDPLIK